MCGTTFFIGVLGLLAGVSLATDVKDCPADQADKRLKAACAKILQDQVGGFGVCAAICSRTDPDKPYTPGSTDNAFNAINAPFISVDTYKEMEKECGSHNGLVKELENVCGCFSEGYWAESSCKINLGKPEIKPAEENLNNSTGSATSTAFPADTTKGYQPTSTSAEEDTDTAETTTAKEAETSTSLVYGHKSTSITSSMSEHETETAEPTTSSMTTHKTSKTTTHMEEKSTFTTDTEHLKSTGQNYGNEETSTDDSPMPSTRGYQDEVSTSTTSTMEATHKSTSTKQLMATTFALDDMPKYSTEYPTSVEEETTNEMDETSMMHTTTHLKQTTMKSTSKHTTTHHSEVEETSSRPYGQVEETSTEEYAAPSYTKASYPYRETTSETTTMKPTTTNRGYYNVETSSEEHTEYPTMSMKQNTTSTKSTKSYDYETSMEETTTEAQRGYTTPPASYGRHETSTGSKAMTTDHEPTNRYYNHSTSASTRSPMGYSTMEESTKSPMGYGTTEESTKFPMYTTTTEEPTKSPMKYTTSEEPTPTGYTMEESSEPTMSSTTMEGSSKPQKGYTTMEETKTAVPYQTTTETKASKDHTTTHLTTTKPSVITWTMDQCEQPTETADAGYADIASVNLGCLAIVSGYSRDKLCEEASMSVSNKGKWGQLDQQGLDAYKEGYAACGDKLPLALKKVCNCIDSQYTGPVPTDKPRNLGPETLPPVCAVKPCPNENKALPKNCLKHAEEYPLGHQQALCGLLCNKKEGGADLDSENQKYYWTFHDRCGSHESLVVALTESCGCVLEDFDQGKTCVYPRTGPKNDTRPIESQESTMKPSSTSLAHTPIPASYNDLPAYTTPQAYMTTSTPQASTTLQASEASTSAQLPKKTYIVEECPKDYEGKGEWPSGNCLDEVFGTKEGMGIAHMICNYQCADFQQLEWPKEQTETYEKALMKCKSPMVMTEALAKGCGCLNDGWVDKCRPQCHPPPGYITTIMMSKTSMQPMKTTTPSMKDTTMTASWTTTFYVTQPCNGCQLTTITTVVPCSTSNTSTTETTSMMTFTSIPVVSTTTWVTTLAPPNPITSPSSWSTITYATTKCGGCPETTVITTVPCPVTLSKVKIDHGNAQTCTTQNDIPQCTVPPGKLEGKAYNSNCNQWYLIKEGDTCQAVTDKIPVDMNLLKEWNGMGAADNCTCSPGRWLCVALLEGKDKHESVRYAKGHPTYSDYGPEATDYDNLPKPSPRPYLPEPIPSPETTPVTYYQ
ncbi:uncharacterized protein DFL_003408 [Arthrobotrys flagrans]|uniref:LysM domain-containing protein n=1 Tax=Arthrobotrys flagrans TaxID=97331 RepID=A0A437A1S6_ARTFL|nr:hypothetical protein DFL_003408 [Arthrobotrys flagrans]